MKKYPRISKKMKAIRNGQQQQQIVINRQDLDRQVFDLVLGALYDNSDKNVLDLEKEIYKPFNVQLPPKEAERIWDVLVRSGLVNPVVGFGNAGKLELSKTGFQLMSQYGSYTQYLAASQLQQQVQNQQPTIILQMPGVPPNMLPPQDPEQQH